MKLRKFGAAAAVADSAPGLFGAAQAAIVADVLFVIDTSVSMGGDIGQVKTRITEFNTVMVANGIDSQYGLVRFGGATSLIQDITTFDLFTQAGSPFSTLSANGGATEDGWAAIQTALTASHHSNLVRNIILITDEDDDVTGNRPALDSNCPLRRKTN